MIALRKLSLTRYYLIHSQWLGKQVPLRVLASASEADAQAFVTFCCEVGTHGSKQTQCLLLLQRQYKVTQTLSEHCCPAVALTPELKLTSLRTCCMYLPI